MIFLLLVISYLIYYYLKINYSNNNLRLITKNSNNSNSKNIKPNVILTDTTVTVKSNGVTKKLSRKCPNAGCMVDYDKKSNEFVCPCHQSKFNIDGKVIKDSAEDDLNIYYNIENMDNYNNYKSNNKKYMYRLGDMVKSKEYRDQNIGYKLHYNYFKNSIAVKYMQLTNKDNDYDTLLTIIKDYKLNYNYDKNTLIIHLRTGDVIDNSGYTVNELLDSYKKYLNTPFIYVKPYSYYEDKLIKIKKYNIKNIILITGFHKNHNYSKSFDYIDKIKQFFEKRGYNVSTRIDEDPDDDFVIMCKSKYYIPSGGGFSRIISKMVELNKGIII